MATSPNFYINRRKGLITTKPELKVGYNKRKSANTSPLSSRSLIHLPRDYSLTVIEQLTASNIRGVSCFASSGDCKVDESCGLLITSDDKDGKSQACGLFVQTLVGGRAALNNLEEDGVYVTFKSSWPTKCKKRHTTWPTTFTPSLHS
jgi:hypothetical protein